VPNTVEQYKQLGAQVQDPGGIHFRLATAAARQPEQYSDAGGCGNSSKNVARPEQYQRRTLRNSPNTKSTVLDSLNIIKACPQYSTGMLPPVAT
jgi:hypothetical protein